LIFYPSPLLLTCRPSPESLYPTPEQIAEDEKNFNGNFQISEQYEYEQGR
ncbi:7072_t:CDS:2, partial [Entrophospora sp. SA101]